MKYLASVICSKISDIEPKYFITSDYNKFTRDIFNARIKEKGLVDKSAAARLINNTDLNKKSSGISN